MESIYSQQNKCERKNLLWEVWKYGKHYGKRRKCWLPAFSHFPTMFSKGFFLKVIKSWDCVGKSRHLKTRMTTLYQGLVSTWLILQVQIAGRKFISWLSQEAVRISLPMG